MGTITQPKVTSLVAGCPGPAKRRAGGGSPGRPKTRQGLPGHPPFRASRGGDGGTAAAVGGDGAVVGGQANKSANKREVLTAAPPASGPLVEKSCVVAARRAVQERLHLAPTLDPFDQAHGVMNPRGMFYPAARMVMGKKGEREAVDNKVAGACPRRYPVVAMASDPEERPTVSFDSVCDATFEAQLRLAGVPGIGVGGGDEDISAALHPRNRDLLRRRTCVAISMALTWGSL